MNKGKWTLNRIFAFLLALMMILTVPEVSSAAVIDADTEDAVVESTETKEVVEEAIKAEVIVNEAAKNETVVYEGFELGKAQTAGLDISFFTDSSSVVSLKEGNYAKWIERITMPQYGVDLYNTLVEATDNDGTLDYLIDDEYVSTSSTLALGSQEVGVWANCIPITTISNATSADFNNVAQVVYAAYSAFDRDYPEVFWLTGSVYILTSTASNGTVTYYLALEDHLTSENDMRSASYKTANAIETDMTTRDTQVSKIVNATTSLDTKGKIDYFNEWLTGHNEYCTTFPSVPEASYECLSALKGSVGESGPVCESYARAFKVLCDKVGIPCVLVSGYASATNGGTGEAHMWNYVQLNNIWYAMDVTWNDPTGGASGAVSGGENTGWSLLGSNTLVASNWTFIQSHPVENLVFDGATAFTNGPVLSEKAYEVSDIKSATIDNWETIYGYGADTTPTVNITLEDNATGAITYKWFEASWNSEGKVESWSEIAGATTNKLPSGLDSNYYYVQVYYDGEEVLYSDVFVYMKELTPTITGTTSKTYDGTTSYTGDDLSITLDGVVNNDVISATADFVYSDANAGTNKTISATNIVLEGAKADNYYIDENVVVSAKVGTITAKDISGATVALDKNELTYNGKVQTVNPTVTVGGKTLAEGTDYTVSGNTAEDVKDSAYTVTVTGKGNYTGTVTATYTISYLEADVTILYNAEEHVPAWVNENVTISAAGYTISDSLDGTYSVDYVISKEGETAGLTLYFKNEEGYITDAKAISTINIDKTAPTFTGENDGIKVATNVWKEFLNTITFGIFHIDTQDVSISATDDGSGVLTYWYYVDKSGSTTVKTAEELEECTFTALEPNSKFSISEDGKYVIYAYASDAAENVSGYICTNGIVIDTTAPTITNVVKPTVDNGNLKDTSATITFTASEAGSYYVITGTDANATYTAEQIAQNNADTMVAGQNTFTLNPFEPNTYHVVYIAVRDTAGNLSDVVTKIEFTTQKTLPTITANPTITGTYGDAVKDMTLTGGTASVSGTWAISTEATDVPEVGTTNKYVVIFTPADTNAYGSVSVEVVPTVAKKAVTVTIDNASKTFGTDNPGFTYTANGLVGSESTDVLGITISTTATKTSDAGTYAITGTANAKNYSVTFTNGTLTINKATASNPSTIEKEYVYGLGSEGTVTINVGALLPADKGTTEYVVEVTGTNKDIVTNATILNDVLTYSVATGNLDDSATIRITVNSKNYTEIIFAIDITLVDKLDVNLATGNEVTAVGSLTYGDALSKLTFDEVSFVDSDGNPVAGTLTWNTPNAILEAGGNEVEWTFTPSNTGKYKVVTGKLYVEVARATPNLSTPTVDAMVYDPNRTLADVTIKSEAATVPGTWSWVTPEANVLAGTKEYEVVFTPNDIDNYKTVTKTVNVEVAKATPYVSVLPAANSIKYGNNISAAGLNGGTVVYAENDSRPVSGTWNWEDANIKPSTIGTHTYKAVFSPEDSSNYNSITVEIEVVVEKAEWPPVMPAGGKVGYWCETLGDVQLPENWVWAEEDADTPLSTEVYTPGTVIYVGDDKDCYVKTERSINIIPDLQTAPHVEGDETAMGWDKIDEEIVNSDGEEVRVDMNGFSHIDTSVLETLKEENAVVVFVLEDGTEWTIKGSDISDEEMKSYIDMNAELFDKDATDKPAIPETLVKDVVTGAKDHKFLSLLHDGEFGFKASLTINVGTANAGKLATLYYYNETSGKLEETENVKIEVAADGTIVLAFEHASDYVLAINDKVVTPPQGGEGGSTPEPAPAPTAPKTGDGVFGNIYFYITLLLAGGLASFVAFRKKREELL